MTIAAIVLTSVLVAITAFYAWQTKRTVDELRRARGANILPRIALSFEHPGPKLVFVLLTNVGTGPALDVNVTVAYEPGGPTTPWKVPVMATGQRYRLRPPFEDLSMANLRKFERITLTGSCKDALGDAHSVDDWIKPGEYWDALVEAQTLWERDPIKELKEEIGKIRTAIERLARNRETDR